MNKRSILLPVAAVGAGVATALATRPLALILGSTPDERVALLPGDDLVEDCEVQADRAITISAPAESVWPWLVQIGQDRAGFYSYEALENAIGCEITTVSELRPEWSTREVGEQVTLAPGMALEVAISEPPRALVLAVGLDGAQGAEPDDGASANPRGLPEAFTWAFIVVDEGDGTSRLLVRERYRFQRGDGLARFAVPFASAVMTQKMLRTIRDLAEA